MLKDMNMLCRGINVRMQNIMKIKNHGSKSHEGATKSCEIFYCLLFHCILFYLHGSSSFYHNNSPADRLTYNDWPSEFIDLTRGLQDPGYQFSI